MHLNGWITDCIHMDEFSSLVVASSGEERHFLCLLNKIEFWGGKREYLIETIF